MSVGWASQYTANILTFSVTFYAYAITMPGPKYYFINGDVVAHSVSDIVLDPDVPDCTFTYTAYLAAVGVPLMPWMVFSTPPNTFTY